MLPNVPAQPPNHPLLPPSSLVEAKPTSCFLSPTCVWVSFFFVLLLQVWVFRGPFVENTTVERTLEIVLLTGAEVEGVVGWLSHSVGGWVACSFVNFAEMQWPESCNIQSPLYLRTSSHPPPPLASSNGHYVARQMNWPLQAELAIIETQWQCHSNPIPYRKLYIQQSLRESVCRKPQNAIKLWHFSQTMLCFPAVIISILFSCQCPGRWLLDNADFRFYFHFITPLLWLVGNWPCFRSL